MNTLAKEGVNVPIAAISKLKNGIKVVTTNRVSHIKSIGVLVNAGSRHTAKFPQGITQMIKRMSFKGVPEKPTESDLLVYANSHGGDIFCDVQRDLAAYYTKFYSQNVEEMVSLLSESIFKPIISESELEAQKRSTLADQEMQEYNPEYDIKFMDHLYEASYFGNTIGLREIPTKSSLEQINVDIIKQFYSCFYKFDRMVVTGINVEHAHLTELVEKYFNNIVPSWENNQTLFDDSVSQYTGGISKLHDETPRKQPGHVVFPEFAYLGIGFEGVPEQSEKVYPLALLYSLLGQGKSFSVGGPGKGLHSRVNQNVLNRFYWVNSCESYVQAFGDTGFFTIHGTCDPTYVGEFVNVILSLYYNILNDPISDVELSRSKNQLLWQLLTNLEHTEYVMEDMGRQFMYGDKYKNWTELWEKVHSVTAEDVKEVCHSLLKTNPSVAAMGNLRKLPDFENIKSAVARYEHVKLKKYWFLD